MIEFTVYGDPKSLKRHRTTKTGIQYDPSKADKADFLAMAMKHRPNVPFNEPLAVVIVAEFARPGRHYNKKGLRPDAEEYCIKTPDADNIIKFVCDALNGVFWKDDKVIADVRCVKLYNETPKITIAIDPLMQADPSG